ncbi:MAP kinase-interacting serine/threonine-protein kinase 2-like protein [Dinothrombium tinctorium]|uniref:MAP kinase-interacting serine/threonine-protein kinase 2-like protein n=2 Tax=Dinothrombium tinctorium TaxID=1965070 RepID=A0A3S3Q142_9ACAR|nr:MAP kinase-interacting serine/threonine-protein kinase 2-like protein [Dinothrombium tinctorium]
MCDGCQDDMLESIINEEVEFFLEDSDDISDEAVHLIKHLLEKDPKLRYSAKMVLDHPWVTKMKK